MPTDLKVFRVPCYNHKDGCQSVVEYVGEKPVRKLCQTCLDLGTPTERVGGTLGAMPKIKGLGKGIPKHFMEYGSDPLYQVTAWPKASFYTNGRVSISPRGQ